MNSIEKVFSEGNKPVFIGYLMAGHPSLEKTPSLIKAMEDGGADMIEIGIPYSDPLADGPIIQKAGQEALKNGTTVDGIFEMIRSIRRDVKIPLLVMVYFSTIFKYGMDKFTQACSQSGIDGIIIPDLPLEERMEIMPAIKNKGLSLIPIVSPASGERVKDIVEDGSGFVYCVSTLGVTGENGHFHRELSQYIKKVRKLTSLPLAVGFGISRHEDVEQLSSFSDGVIVGSALVKTIDDTNGDEEVLKRKIEKLKHG